MNIKLTLAYDGTNYYGWQKTSTGPSIEGSLESALRQILQEPIVLQAASRTDRGVHATSQVVNFHTSHSLFDFKKLRYSLNCLLPKDIVVLDIEEKASSFHPTLHVTSKTYRYEICNSQVQLPRYRLYSWHFCYPIERVLIQQAAQLMEGSHDFSSFCNQKKNESYQNHLREVQSIRIEFLPEERLQIKITGQHFLYKMVRNLVGTMLYVGSGKLTLQDIEKLFNHPDRKKAGMTAPAHGLTLEKIAYSEF